LKGKLKRRIPNNKLNELKEIEEQCRLLLLRGHVEAENVLSMVLLKIELLRPRMGNYAGKVNWLDIARYRNEKLKEKKDDNTKK